MKACVGRNNTTRDEEECYVKELQRKQYMFTTRVKKKKDITLGFSLPFSRVVVAKRDSSHSRRKTR